MHTVSLLIISLMLLLVISVGCYYHFTSQSQKRNTYRRTHMK